MVERIAIIYIESEVQTMRTEKKELNVQIGKRLQTVRENSGYTQEAFAEALDIGVEHYRKIELGMYGLQRENMLILYDFRYFSRNGHKIPVPVFGCLTQTGIPVRFYPDIL